MAFCKPLQASALHCAMILKTRIVRLLPADEKTLYFMVFRDDEPRWHVPCLSRNDVRMGTSLSKERISPVLDETSRLLPVIRQRGGLARREFAPRPLPAKPLAGCIAEAHVDALLGASLSEFLCRATEEPGNHTLRINENPSKTVLETLCTALC